MKTYSTFIVTLLAALIYPMIGKAAAEPSTVRNIPLIYQIPIKDQIEPALLYVVRRGVLEAKKQKADAVVFLMDTPGGSVKETREIMSLIGQINVPVYTFIEKDAYSAGAIIALSTPHIYMAPGSVIGAATPLMMGPLGGVEELPDAVEEKMTSAVAALVRAAAEQGGHDPQIGEAMVRRELGFTSGTNVLCKAGELLTLTASEAEGILSDGTVKDVAAMLEKAGLPNAEIRELTVTPAERIARVIAGFAPILLIIGLGGIYLEIKTPGFGLPGIAGTFALVLFFFGHHLAGLAGMEDVILFVIGVILLLIEVFVTPGFGLLGISGLALMLFSLVSAMSWQPPGELLPTFSGSGATLQHALRNLALGTAGTILLGILAGKYLPKSRIMRPLVLAQSTDKAEGFTAACDRSELLGKEGTAEMNLHPAGRALFAGERINVITRGEFIEKNSAVRVIEATGSRILVEKI
ncbi:MAG: ATP-dependent Clp protease proteolytic subunit [Pontiellaceae bacterium]|nr:ATP-dependent Clp protease proteolytic subunit [Pontiellaceae bacterium]